METALEIILTTSYKDGMISFLKANPEYFEEAVQLALGDKQPYSWRAAWLLWSCLGENDSRLRKYISEIINVLPDKKDGHQRELMKILTKMELTEEQEGYLFNFCMTVWESIHKSPSVRYNAFIFLLKTVEKHPELMNEMVWFTQNQYLETLSPGVRHSLLRLIKKQIRTS